MDYAPYRQCVLERVSTYAVSDEDIATITSAALSDCKSAHALAIGRSLERTLKSETKSEQDRLDSSRMVGSNQNFERLDQMLKQDIASVVLRKRVKQ